MKGLLEASKVVPVIYRCYPLSGGVPEALWYLEERHAQVKVVITEEQNGKY